MQAGHRHKELIEEVGQLDALFVCLGGGGLLSGSALAARHLSPDCIVYGVEPEAGNDGQQSFRSGKIVHIDTPKTIADGAQTQHLGNYTFQIIQQNVNDILTVSDAELITSMKFIAERMKIVVEPTGCLGFAAARARKAELRGKKSALSSAAETWISAATVNFWPDDKQGICDADTLMLLSVHCRLEKRSVTVNCSQSWQQASPQETGMPKPTITRFSAKLILSPGIE